MPTTPEQEQLIYQWTLAKEKLAEARKLVEEEMRLRRLVAQILFPSPKEGTNKTDLPNGWQLKFTYNIERDIDKAALPAVCEGLRSQFGVNPDNLIRQKPELNVKPYRELTDEQKKFFDQALKIHPGTPVLELVPPKDP